MEKKSDVLDLFDSFQEGYVKDEMETMSLQEYLVACRDNPLMYAGTARRMVAAIGEPTLIDTSKDERLGRIFFNRTIKQYSAFSNFYGMESVIEDVVGYFNHAAQGLEERKQILYLLGPVGGGKSSLAEQLKKLMEVMPVYVLMDKGGNVSPIFESPLGLFDPDQTGELFEGEYGIPRRYVEHVMSPWAIKRLHECKGDISQFRVARMFPSRLLQRCIAKTEPGDENNQDISTLVGKLDIRQLERFSQNDPDAYAYDGGLNLSTQGLLEFVEMFKAPIKVLHPLLTATQEGNYLGTESIGAFPYQGTILAHSNESEWETFKGNKNNEAFLDRICTVKVPYCLRVTEEKQIYEKLLTNSELADASCAPEVLEMLARFHVASRLVDPENSKLFSKMRIYDGETLKDTDPKAKSLQEYREVAGIDEGMKGVSTRFAFKILSKTFNFDSDELAADPVHLLFVLEKCIRQEQFSDDKEKAYLEFLHDELSARYADFIGVDIRKAYIESYGSFGQNLFDQYVAHADAWIQERDFKDPDTGVMYDRETLDDELQKIEKPAGIGNSKDFRNEVVNFVLRAKAENGGKNPDWKAYEKLREVIEKRMFSSIEDLLPVITFGPHKDKKMDKEHDDFVSRMMDRGYTRKQVQRVVEWYMRVKKAG